MKSGGRVARHRSRTIAVHAADDGAHQAPARSTMSDPQQRASEPVLITDAELSYEEALKVRKQRYKLTMGMRIPLMVLAAVFYQTPWVAVTLLVLSIPLPWIAVLMANDRLPRKVEDPNRYKTDRRAIEPKEHPVIDG
jgi:Flp pilus assembly protein TadB